MLKITKEDIKSTIRLVLSYIIAIVLLPIAIICRIFKR